MSYTVYNKSDGNIIKTVVCSPDQIGIQYDSKTAAHIEGEYDKAAYKVVRGRAVLKAETEQADYQYSLVKDTIPPIKATLTDTELDTYISQYFYGRVDVQQWKKEHYHILRRRHYPPIEDYIDAQTKLNSQDSKFSAEGQIQMQDYVNKCLAVKARFSKPTTIKEEVK